eukprot:365741-Chlamydomonas_euryale.AAC.13
MRKTGAKTRQDHAEGRHAARPHSRTCWGVLPKTWDDNQATTRSALAIRAPPPPRHVQFDVLGSGEPPACKYYTYSYELLLQEQQLQQGVRRQRSLLQLAYPSGDIDAVVTQAYERILIVAIVGFGALLLHWLALALWSSCACSMNASLPSLLVFPHIELLLAVVTVLALAQSAGALMASGRGGPAVVGVLVLVYLLSLLSLLVMLTRALSRTRGELLAPGMHVVCGARRECGAIVQVWRVFEGQYDSKTGVRRVWGGRL